MPPSEHGSEGRKYKDVYTNKAASHGDKSGFLPESNTPEPICSKDCSDIQSDIEKFNEFIKNGRDLYAQEGMWRAANLLVVLTYIQVCVGGLTAFYLVMTFRTQRSELGQARRTADAAESESALEVTRSATVLEMKPYLKVLSCEFDEVVALDNGTFATSFVVTIKNCGKSAA